MMNKLKEIRKLFFGVAEYINTLRLDNGRADVLTLSSKSIEVIENFKMGLDQLAEYISPINKDKLSYSVCALLDEQTISILTDEEREIWLTSPLQIKYYANNNSGERICDEIEKICFERESNDDFLALGYAMILKLGFLGAFSTNKNRYHNIILGLKNRYPELYDDTYSYFPNNNQRLKVWRFVDIKRVILVCMVVVLGILYFYCVENI